jgi:hypothetical protein
MLLIVFTSILKMAAPAVHPVRPRVSAHPASLVVPLME